MSALHEKLKKLLALARRGVGGEQVNAQAILESMMEKHGISISDLDDETQTMEWFKPAKGDFGKKLFYQTLAAVVGNRTTWKNTYSRVEVGAKVTPAEKVEFELRYAAYCGALKKEMDICYSAFVQVNHIFHKDAPPADESEIDKAEIERLAMAMVGMAPVSIRPALELNTEAPGGAKEGGNA